MSAIRGEALRALARFMIGASPARPRYASVIAAVDFWLSAAMDEDTAAEYQTASGDVEIDGLPVEDELYADPVSGKVDAAVVDQVQQRIWARKQLAATSGRVGLQLWEPRHCYVAKCSSREQILRS